MNYYYQVKIYIYNKTFDEIKTYVEDNRNILQTTYNVYNVSCYNEITTSSINTFRDRIYILFEFRNDIVNLEIFDRAYTYITSNLETNRINIDYLYLTDNITEPNNYYNNNDNLNKNIKTIYDFCSQEIVFNVNASSLNWLSICTDLNSKKYNFSLIKNEENVTKIKATKKVYVISNSKTILQYINEFNDDCTSISSYNYSREIYISCAEYILDEDKDDSGWLYNDYDTRNVIKTNLLPLTLPAF